MDKKRSISSAKPVVNINTPEKKLKTTISNPHIFKQSPPQTGKDNSALEVPKDPTHRVHRTQPVVGRRNLQVPKLVDLATQTIVDNLDSLKEVGDVPEHLLTKILSHCNPEQLLRLEESGLKKKRDLGLDKYWKKHCERVFSIDISTKDALQENRCSTWRALFIKKQVEDENKLKSFSEKARAMYQKNEQLKAAKSVRVIEQPLNAIREARSRGFSLGPSRGGSGGGGGYTRDAPPKPKAAPLMQKTLKQLQQIKKTGTYKR